MYGSGQDVACNTALEIPSRPTMSQRLSSEKERLEKRLAEVNKALEVLKKYPEMQEVVDILSKI